MRERIITNPEWEWMVVAVFFFTAAVFLFFVARAIRMKREKRTYSANLPLREEKTISPKQSPKDPEEQNDQPESR